MKESTKKNTEKRTFIKVIRWLLLAAAASLVCFFALRFMWKRGYFLPGWIQWEEHTVDYTFTVSRDSRVKVRSKAAKAGLEEPSEDDDIQKVSETVNVRLKDKKLTVKKEDGTLLWKSEEDWLVSDFLIGDIDHDDEDEIVLLVWKIGSFGDYKPIWVEQDEKKWSQHIFIYDYDVTVEDRLYPLWMSSKMGIEARSISLDTDEKLHIMIPKGKESLWSWQSWGLVLEE